MIELQMEDLRDLVNSILSRQFARCPPQRFRNPLPPFAFATPALQLPVYLPHRTRHIGIILCVAALQLRHGPTLSTSSTQVTQACRKDAKLFRRVSLFQESLSSALR